VAEVLGYKTLQIVPTGGNTEEERAREQWNDGNNVLALRPRRRGGRMTAMTIPTRPSRPPGSRFWRCRTPSLAGAGAVGIA